MQFSLLRYLACPHCRADLALKAFRLERTGEIDAVRDGVLLCNTCRRFYIVSRSVPRLVPGILARDPGFARTYARELREVRNVYREAEVSSSDPFRALKERTRRNFGFEWKTWNTFGWNDDKDVDMEKSRQIFEYKVMAKRGELKGKLVLDAGCGNGRYARVAREYGGEVIGIDLIDTVDVALANAKGDPKIHIVQGDLFHLPFKREIFDFIFSNGVLMHTGDARRAFLSLVPHLAPDGAVTIHLYHKGNPLYEFNDWWLRAITTRIPLPWAYQFTRTLAGIARALPKTFVNYGLNAVFRIEPHHHYTFDWYTAPIATHHTYPEVYGWLKEVGLHLVADHNATHYPWRKWVLPFFFLTVKAQKTPYRGEVLHTTK